MLPGELFVLSWTGFVCGYDSAAVTALTGITFLTQSSPIVTRSLRMTYALLQGHVVCSRRHEQRFPASAQAEGRHMLAQGHGKIINMASMATLLVPHPQKQIAYNASKAAVVKITQVCTPAPSAPRPRMSLMDTHSHFVTVCSCMLPDFGRRRRRWAPSGRTAACASTACPQAS